MSYVGNTPVNQNFVAGADQFNGTGSQTVFTLSRRVNTVFDMFVTVSNVPQDPFTAYTVSGNTLTFDSAPPSGTNNIDVVYRATNVQTFVPSPGATVGGSFGVQGNLNFFGTGNRITGDFSNGTIANRMMFQTSTVNGNTTVSAIPNGTGTAGQFAAYSAADPTNSSVAALAVFGGNDVRINSSILGTGTYLPMTFFTGGSERMRIDTSGNVGIGTSTPSQKLDVVGSGSVNTSIRVRNDSGIGDLYALATGDVFLTSQSAGKSLIFGSVGIERARIDSSGNFYFNSGYGSVATAYGCRAWVNFNGTGTVAIRASGNVSSITDNGVGDYTVNFTTSMPDANYAAAAQANTAASYGYTAFERAAKATSSYRVQCATTNAYTSTDCDQVTVAIFR